MRYEERTFVNCRLEESAAAMGDISKVLPKIRSAAFQADTVRLASNRCRHPRCDKLRMTRKLSRLFLCFLILLESCIVSRDERILKRTGREWREAEIVLHAWADSPFAGQFLTLRDNGKFEHYSSGIMQYYGAGSWTRRNDTLHLRYVESRQNSIKNRDLVIDRLSSTLIFAGDSAPFYARLRIVKIAF